MGKSAQLDEVSPNTVVGFERKALPAVDRGALHAGIDRAAVVSAVTPDLSRSALEIDPQSLERMRQSAIDSSLIKPDVSGVRSRIAQDAAVRQRQFEDTVRETAYEEASRDFKRAAKADTARLQRKAASLARAHSIEEDEDDHAFQLFQKSYESRWKECVDHELNWFERQCHKAKSWLAGNAPVLAAVIVPAAECAAVLVKGVAAIVRKAVDLGIMACTKEGREKIASFCKNVTDILTSKQFREMLLNSAKAGLKALVNPETWKALGRSIWDGVKGAALGLASFALAVVTDPLRALRMTLKALKTVGVVAWELTGIPSVKRMLECAARGDWKGFCLNAVNAALCWGTMAATVGLAWSGAPVLLGMVTGRTSLQVGARQLMKVAAEKFLGKAADQLGDLAVRQLEKNVGREKLQQTLKSAAVEIADKGVRELGERVMKQGSSALTHEAVHEVVYKGAKETAERVSRELGVDKIAAKLTTDLLEGIESKSAKRLAKQLMEQGLASTKKEAGYMARGIKDILAAGKSDHEIAGILTKGMTKHLSEYFEGAMREPFMHRFQSGLLGKLDGELAGHSQALFKAVKEQAGKLGKSVDDLAREYTETAWQAARKGIHDGIETVVREGVERGFEDYRSRRKSASTVKKKDAEEEQKKAPGRALEKGEDPRKTKHEADEWKLRKDLEQRSHTHRIAVDRETAEGRLREIFEVEGVDGANKRLVSSETIKNEAVSTRLGRKTDH